MSFANFHQHCMKCKKGKPCNKKHVYVMELKLEVYEKSQKFKDANPNYKQGMPCVYVGKTSHHPRCRQSQHNNCKIGDWQGKKWTCYCGMKSETVSECKLSTRTSSKVGKFMTGFLLKSLYKKYNPQSDSQSNEEAEEKLANDLRSQGFGVWAGHLDSS